MNDEGDKPNGELVLNLNRVSAYVALGNAAIQIGEGAEPPSVEMSLGNGPGDVRWDEGSEIAPDLILFPTMLGIGRLTFSEERGEDARAVTRVRLTTTSETFRAMILEWWAHVRKALVGHIRGEPEPERITLAIIENAGDQKLASYIRDGMTRGEIVTLLGENWNRKAISDRAYRLRKKYGEELVPEMKR